MKMIVEPRRASFPKSVFAAGTAKRTTDMLRKKQTCFPRIRKNRRRGRLNGGRGTGRMQPPDRPLTTTEWRKLKESWETPQRFDIQMMGALFTSRAELDIAKSLLTFVAMETGTLSYELLLRYLTLCVSAGHDAEVFEVYDIMRGSFPALDTGASSLFIKPSAGPVFHAVTTHYGDIIEAAVRHGDRATAWSLYDELLEKG
ncbi:mitochondrial ribonuclease P catalytic subunit-like [Salarias fasciatus]|uniref:mitochondrial ribonuclease P catalytic subunit-like n=1 Tax=Salarias fasciatus TaxID=181472 RepID=UPI001176983C|nr:mitochondrial ribonuclease P catalytic subunit-like [Salarias fasciatus]